jgi:hypothetical protein
VAAIERNIRFKRVLSLSRRYSALCTASTPSLTSYIFCVSLDSRESSCVYLGEPHSPRVSRFQRPASTCSLSLSLSLARARFLSLYTSIYLLYAIEQRSQREKKFGSEDIHNRAQSVNLSIGWRRTSVFRRSLRLLLDRSKCVAPVGPQSATHSSIVVNIFIFLSR